MTNLVSVVVSIALMALTAGAARADNTRDTAMTTRMKAMGYVVVTPGGPDDGADFGPGTPGTRTSGLQEALDHAKRTKRDVYIAGPGVYKLSETLGIPWGQNWRIDGGEYLIWYEPKQGDAVTIDSQMNCFIKLGLVATASDGACVRMKPVTKGPDDFVVVTASDFYFNGFVGAGDIWGKPGGRGKSLGLVLDGSAGPIVCNRIFAIEANACDLGIYLTGNASANWIESPFMHLCNTHIQIGDDSSSPSGNRIRAHIDSQGTVEGSIGVRVFGHQNVLDLNIVRAASGKGVVLERSAAENVIKTGPKMPEVTNLAARPGNRIVSAEPQGFSVATPSVPASGEDAVNSSTAPVEIIILSPGKVASWTISDVKGSSQSVTAPLLAGERFTLHPGESIRFDYSEPPAWKWRGM